MKHTLVLATRNNGKIVEFRRILDSISAGAIELIGIDQFPELADVEETLTAFEAIREKLVNGTYKEIAERTTVDVS